jgi:uncharacterized protein
MNSATDQRTSIRRIFIGPLGLRAGWSLLIYLALVISIVGAIHVTHDHFRDTQKRAAIEAHRLNPSVPLPLPHDPNAPSLIKTDLIVHAAIFSVFFVVTWLMARIERRRLGVFGLGGSHPILRLLTGSFWGIVAVSLLIAILHALHFLTFDRQLEYGPAILGWGAAQLLVYLLVGLFEEYAFRGYLQFTLTRGFAGLGNIVSRLGARTIAFWLAAVVTSALFLAAHISNDGESKLGLIQVFLFGMLAIVALWRTGSLWWAIGFHMAWDWGQSFLYGVPDSGGFEQGRLFATHASGNPLLSGGTVGPEGSILAAPVLLLALIVLFFTHRSPQPPLEQDSKLLQTASHAPAS